MLFQVSALFSGTYKQLNLWESRAYMEIKDHKYEKRIMDEEIGKIMSFIKAHFYGISVPILTKYN